MPPVKWTAEKSTVFWRKRDSSIITADANLARRNTQRLNLRRDRQQREEANRHAFVQRYRSRGDPTAQPIILTEEADIVAFWVKHQSWSYCVTCGSLTTEKMLPSYANRRPIHASLTCSCSKDRYTLSSPDEVSLRLLDLTQEDILILRPLDIHTGDYQKKQHGYRVRTSSFRVSWSSKSVQEKINGVTDAASRRRCALAYTQLIRDNRSDYNKFIQMRDVAQKNPWPYEIYSNEAYKGIECALWPNLYYSCDLCESHIDGTASRQSGKVAYVGKVMGPLLDYALSFELLHYQYDRWMFKTITGAFIRFC